MHALRPRHPEAPDLSPRHLPVYFGQSNAADHMEGKWPWRTMMETTTATAPHNKPAAASFTVRPLSPALGAEILGVDLRDPIDDSLKQKFLDAWHQHLIILVRNQTLDEEAQVRFAETFGPPAKVTSGPPSGANPPNVMQPPTTRGGAKPLGALPDGEMHFHPAQCHQPIPAKATMLYAIEIPSEGGDTLFANAYPAYETLPEH